MAASANEEAVQVGRTTCEVQAGSEPQDHSPPFTDSPEDEPEETRGLPPLGTGGPATWSADSSWYSERPRGFWTRKRGSYLDLPPWAGLDPRNEAAARERLVGVLLSFPLGGSRTQRYPRRNPPGRELGSGRPTLRDCAEELGVKRVGEHDWGDACPPTGGKPDVCAALCALASSGRDGEVIITEWLYNERKRQEEREQYRQRVLHDFVCVDVLAAVVYHGYDPPLAGSWKQLCRQVLRLRQVSTAFRAAVDCDAVWERYYIEIIKGKNYQPPAIARLLEGPAAHFEAFRHVAVEHNRRVLTVDDLCSVRFYSRAKPHPAVAVEQLEVACPWWRRTESGPRQHRFGRDGVLRSYTFEGADGSLIERVVGPWCFVSAPAGFSRNVSYVRTGGRVTVVWEVRRTGTWDILMVSANGIKSTSQLARRGRNDDGSVSSEFAMSRSKEEKLWAIGRAIEADSRKPQANTV
jgi:hypothetical protein